MKHSLKSMLLIAALSLINAGWSGPATASADSQTPKPRIVLVHGAFADGSGWQKLIPLLENRGYPVVAVQNSLTSIADDVVTTKRVIDAETAKGPVIVVAHSYGGAVITAAAAGNPQIKALVYVNALAPDVGEALGDLLHHAGPGPLDDALVPDAAGFLYIDRAQFHDVFCADISASDARVLGATQRPISGDIFSQSLDVVAWQDIPSWYVLGLKDQAILPAVQRFMAERMGATITEIDSSHVTFISHPHAVVRVIEDAARATSH
jgi:pimeloyl-ACP methyl ester carboxylesterase